MHANSLKAFSEARATLGTRCLSILKVITESAAPMTDREVMAAMGQSDPNYVRPRITELKLKRLVFEVGETKDEVTGKTVRLVSAKTINEMLF